MAKETIKKQLMVNQGDLGLRLIEYREKAGFSLAQMADGLCLPEETIGKLESESFETLAEPPYIRGYLRNYAKMADTDPGELIDLYEALRGADPSDLDYHFKSSSEIQTKSTQRISPVYAQLFFLALLISVLIGLSMIPGINKWITNTWDSFSGETSSLGNSTSDNPLLTGTMPVPTPFPISKENTTQSSENTDTFPPKSNNNAEDASSVDNPASTSESTDSESASKPPKETTTQTEAGVAQQSDPTPAKETVTSDLINIKLVFNKEVWMRIRDKDNKTLFEATNSAGNEKLLVLKKPLTFRVGNAQGLSLFVDNKAVDISRYIKGSVANFTLK